MTIRVSDSIGADVYKVQQNGTPTVAIVRRRRDQQGKDRRHVSSTARTGRNPKPLERPCQIARAGVSAQHVQVAEHREAVLVRRDWAGRNRFRGGGAVSYTPLTLPPNLRCRARARP